MSMRPRRKKAEMNGNSLGVALSSGGLAGAERSEGERSEPQRSGAAAKAAAGSRPVSPPDSEVIAKPKRRSFPPEYKQRLLPEDHTVSPTPRPLPPLRPPQPPHPPP